MVKYQRKKIFKCKILFKNNFHPFLNHFDHKRIQYQENLHKEYHIFLQNIFFLFLE